MNGYTLPRTLGTRNAYRFGAFALVVAVSVTALSMRMAYLQLVQEPVSYEVEEGNPSEDVPLPASRGLIFDAAGNALVTNLPNYLVRVIPSALYLSDKATVVQRLSVLLNVTPLAIDQAIDSHTGSMFDPVTIADHVPADVARVIAENTDSLPGVDVVVQDLRQYTSGLLYGQLIGYTGHPTEISPEQAAAGYTETDIIGLAGLEQWYEDELRGTYGQAKVALDTEGRPIPGLMSTVTAPVAGSSLTLTIDPREQSLAYKALKYGLDSVRPRALKEGVIIVMNPQDGSILAMVSLPGYDDNVFAAGITEAEYQALLNDPTGPMVNKAIQARYAPGSTYKLVAATGGLQEGVITPETQIESVPYWQIGPDKYWEWNKVGWGKVNIYSGMAHSSDIYFYHLTDMLGLDSLTYWAHQYGFGERTGVDFPNEARGIVPDEQWKQVTFGQPMYQGETIQAGIGQGYDAATPLQMLNAYCALANGGNLWQPRLVSSITHPDGTVTEIDPELIHKLPATAETLRVIRQATREVVTSRHTYNLVDLPIIVAGKTGTAEYGDPDPQGRLPYHEWFVGYVPEDPVNGNFSQPDSELAVLAFVPGARTWGNIATEIVKYYFMLHFNIRGTRYPTDAYYPWHLNAWAFKVTNYYGSANNY
jgi:penicillin-binding protein 2